MLWLGGGAGVGSAATNGGAIKSGSVRVVDVDGSIVEATGEVLVYSEETAGLFSSSQTKTIAFEGNALLKEEVEAGWKTYNFEVRELHNYVANDNDEQTSANDALEFCHKLAA